jgi:hypothetical protein
LVCSASPSSEFDVDQPPPAAGVKEESLGPRDDDVNKIFRVQKYLHV